MKKTIALLGAYGGAGRDLAPLLLQHLETSLILAGRNPAKLKALKASLPDTPEGRVQIRPLDIRQDDQMASLLRESDLAILTTPTPDQLPRIAQLALDNQCHLIDILLDTKHLSEVAPLSASFRRNNLLYLTQAGVHPGIPSTLIRYAAQQVEQLHQATLFLAMQVKIPAPGSTVELIQEIGTNEATILENGQWRKATYRDRKMATFGPSSKKTACYPLNPAEIVDLANQLGLREAGIYAAGFNWLVDLFILPLVMALYPRGQQWLQRLLFWGNNLLTRREYLRFQLSAEGSVSGKTINKTYALFHPEPYYFTAVAVVACADQLLHRTDLPPGIHPMGYILEPEPFFKKLQDLGVRFTEKDI